MKNRVSPLSTGSVRIGSDMRQKNLYPSANVVQYERLEVVCIGYIEYVLRNYYELSRYSHSKIFYAIGIYAKSLPGSLFDLY